VSSAIPRSDLSRQASVAHTRIGRQGMAAWRATLYCAHALLAAVYSWLNAGSDTAEWGRTKGPDRGRGCCASSRRKPSHEKLRRWLRRFNQLNKNRRTAWLKRYRTRLCMHGSSGAHVLGRALTAIAFPVSLVQPAAWARLVQFQHPNRFAGQEKAMR
jgi:hypothetical protein